MAGCAVENAVGRAASQHHSFRVKSPRVFFLKVPRPTTTSDIQALRTGGVYQCWPPCAQCGCGSLPLKGLHPSFVRAFRPGQSMVALFMVESFCSKALPNRWL